MKAERVMWRLSQVLLLLAGVCLPLTAHATPVMSSSSSGSQVSMPPTTRPVAKKPTSRAAVKPNKPAKPSPKVPAKGCAKVAGAPQAHVRWSGDTFAAARQRSLQTGCPVLIDMYATWCYPCKKYDRKVFNRVDVASFVHKHFIPLRRDGMKGEGKMLAKKYNCVTYPCILVIDKQGKEVERITRFMKAQPFMARLAQIKRGKATLASLLPKLAKRPNDPVLRYRIGRRLAYRGDVRCVKHLMFVGMNPPTRYPWLGPRSLYVLGRIYYRNTKRDYAAALKVFQLYLLKYPRARRARRVQGLVNWCQRRLNRARR